MIRGLKDRERERETKVGEKKKKGASFSSTLSTSSLSRNGGVCVAI